MTIKLDKRTGSGWWGGRFNYTWSSTKDNQFGETSFYSRSLATPQNNYDLDAEYGASNFDSPHRIILAPIVRIPGPASGPAKALFGDWMFTAIAELVSGAPLQATISGGVSDANLGLLGGRQRPNRHRRPEHRRERRRPRGIGGPYGRGLVQSRGTFVNPGAGQYGNAPRTNGDALWQFRKTIDVVLAKNIRFSGSQAGEVRFKILNLTNTAQVRRGKREYRRDRS